MLRPLLACAAALLLAACAGTPLPPPGPIVTSIAVNEADAGWHTDVCLRRGDATPWLLALPQNFDGARFLCFGFGERRYMVEHDHSVFVMLSALLPSNGAIVMTPVRGGPETLFGPGNTVYVGISRAGAAGLAAFLRASIRTDASGQPVLLGPGQPPGREYFAATADYDGFNTCNTWTGTALRTAGVPVDDGALFAHEIMGQVRAVAAAQAKGGASYAGE